jgi:hypothetical protein
VITSIGPLFESFDRFLCHGPSNSAKPTSSPAVKQR